MAELNLDHSNCVAESIIEDSKTVQLKLVLARRLARNGELTADSLVGIITHPMDMIEFVAYYWKYGKQPLSYQVKKGLAKCFNIFSSKQFNECIDYEYNGVTIKDIMFLTHPKPKTPEQELLFRKIAYA